MQIREKYNHILFPLDPDDTNPSRIADLYIKEFGYSENSPFENFVEMSLSAANDFLIGRISERGIESLAFFIFTSKSTQKYTIMPYLDNHGELIAFLSELADITWMKSSTDYKLYQRELKLRWKKLVSNYKNYFRENP